MTEGWNPFWAFVAKAGVSLGLLCILYFFAWIVDGCFGFVLGRIIKKALSSRFIKKAFSNIGDAIAITLIFFALGGLYILIVEWSELILPFSTVTTYFIMASAILISIVAINKAGTEGFSKVDVDLITKTLVTFLVASIFRLLNLPVLALAPIIIAAVLYVLIRLNLEDIAEEDEKAAQDVTLEPAS